MEWTDSIIRPSENRYEILDVYSFSKFDFICNYIIYSAENYRLLNTVTSTPSRLKNEAYRLSCSKFQSC